MSESINPEERRIINKTVSIREKIIDSLMQDDKVPTDRDDLKLLLSTLDSTDRTVVSVAKIRNDDANEKSRINAASDVAKLIGTMRDRKLKALEEVREIPSLPDDFNVINPVLGEKDIGESGLCYDEFMKDD